MSATDDFVATLAARHEAGERLGVALIRDEYAAFCEEHDAFHSPERLTTTMAQGGWVTHRDNEGKRWVPEGWSASAGDAIPPFVVDWVEARSCREEDAPDDVRDVGQWAFVVSRMPVVEFYEQMAEACAGVGVTPPGARALANYMTAQGYKRERDENQHYWRGITHLASRENAIASQRAFMFMGSSGAVRSFLAGVTQGIGYSPGYQYAEQVERAFNEAVHQHIDEKHGLKCTFDKTCGRETLDDFEAAAASIPVKPKGTFATILADEPDTVQERAERESRAIMLQAMTSD